MKKFYTLLSIVAFTFAGNAQNLVINPTFAAGLNNWIAGPIAGYTLPTLDASDGSDGSNSAKYIATATTGFYQEVPVIAGHSITISFSYKATGDGTDARIWSNYKDASEVIIYQDITTANDPLRSNNVYLDPATSWTKKTITVTVPANSVKLVLAFRAYSGSTTSFDGMSVVDNTLSVKQNTIEGLKVYPNPVTDGNLYITSNSSEAKTVEVYDILGKQVLSTKTVNNTANVSNLKGGVYFVKITEEGKTATQKLVIE